MATRLRCVHCIAIYRGTYLFIRHVFVRHGSVRIWQTLLQGKIAVLSRIVLSRHHHHHQQLVSHLNASVVDSGFLI